jgi:hypothetical protein
MNGNGLREDAVGKTPREELHFMFPVRSIMQLIFVKIMALPLRNS